MSDNIFQEVKTDDLIHEEIENAYEALVGEGKKFKDPESLAKGKLESDRYVSKLQSELNELRTELSRRQSAEDIKTQILEGLKNKDPQTQPPATPPADPVDPATQKVNIEELVRDTITRAETERTAKQNREIVTTTLRQRFGEDTQIELNKISKQLQIPLTELEALAAKSPKAFFALIGVDNQTQTPSAPAPRSQTQAPVKTSGTRDKAYYERLKASNPSEYFSSKTQKQMYKDAIEQGQSFFG